ncbi:FtsX-like permease family protein [Tetragenococcus koreensis]|uniref:FtsX-like permease family protein n=2 Tax=Tetragenococcus koreensis TaxID=290335 RepID=UPI001F298401|nr:FtsX-like permease family protein [Tetragenococcus koreensis]MCF1620787.1 FtsX-like permease family protein [Tetragenococcus koreensis]MCF1658291.1 FtsX-like permease family protein [Tetragenococcus koreensis]
MKNNVYIRSTFRDIKQSFGRFIAVVLIIFMGVLLFVGIKSVGPDLEKLGNQYFQKQQLSNVQIRGTAGLTTKDKELIEQIDGAHAELGYNFAYSDEENDRNLQVYSFDKEQKQNQLTLEKGSMPTADDEAVIDSQMQDDYEIGQTITIADDQLENQEVKITGYVESPLYINKTERGAAEVGDIDGFIYLSASNFTADAYSMMNLTFSNLPYDFFSDAYAAQLNAKLEDIDSIFDKRKEYRKQELTDDALSEIADEQEELDENHRELADGQEELDEAKDELQEKKDQFSEQKEQVIAAYGAAAADEQLAESQEQLAEAEVGIKGQQGTLDENQQKLAEGQEDIDKARQEAEDMEEPNYLTDVRKNYPGFNEYTSLSDRIDTIGNVFPVFFFLIAILITFTTITRMVEENRKEIGTLKALGYRNREISSKYILYAFFTVLLGATLGVIVGTKFLPPIVFLLLKQMFIFQNYPISFWFTPIMIAMIAAVIATLGSAVYVLAKDLREKPTSLLMPKAPKAGQRIFLERITPLWARLGFIKKVTDRNLFRYKARMILTVLGIAGCTGLIVAGFGLKDSIEAPAYKQFEELNHYQAMVTLNEEGIDNSEQVEAAFKATAEVDRYLPIYSEQVKFKEKGATEQNATLSVTEQPDAFLDFVTFHAETDDSQTHLTNGGAMISDRLAKLYDASVGGSLKMQSAEGDEYEIKIAGITENYLGHNVYMTKGYFNEVTDIDEDLNTYLVKTADMDKPAENDLSQTLEDTDEVMNITFNSDQIETQASSSANLMPIILIFIILSGTLAFVVLYNLTNINISERERELATIKVLGFFNKEVTMYIVRENVIFTILGILFGFGVGKVLTWFIVTMASSDGIVFPLIVPPIGYLMAALMTIVFSAIVMIITHFKLKNIDMIGALKANE